MRQVEYQGTTRNLVPGSLLYPGGPLALGTIIGPRDGGEYVTCVGHDGDRSVFAPTTNEDMQAVPGVPDAPRSPAEKSLLAFMGSVAPRQAVADQ